MFSVRGIKPVTSDNQMSRNFSHPRTGNFCVQIDTFLNRTLSLTYELLNLSDNQVVSRKPLLEGNQIEFEDLQAGDYQLTLRNISEEIISAELCPGIVHFKHRLSMMNTFFCNLQVQDFPRRRYRLHPPTIVTSLRVTK
jgi:hypothetical protein